MPIFKSSIYRYLYANDCKSTVSTKSHTNARKILPVTLLLEQVVGTCSGATDRICLVIITAVQCNLIFQTLLFSSRPIFWTTKFAERSGRAINVTPSPVPICRSQEMIQHKTKYPSYIKTKAIIFVFKR